MNSEIGPSLVETFPGFGRCDKERVLVNRIDLGERFDKIGSVAFITRKLRPN